MSGLRRYGKRGRQRLPAAPGSRAVFPIFFKPKSDESSVRNTVDIVCAAAIAVTLHKDV